MIGRVCLTGFVSIMALGASCEDTRSFNFSTMKLDFVVMAKCLDPRNVDLKRGFDETCASLGRIINFNSSFYRSNNSQKRAASNTLNYLSGSYANHMPSSYAHAATVTQVAYSGGSKIIRVQ